MSGFGYNVLGFGANAAGGGENLPSDDEFNLVSFLSHFDGANNGVNNVFIDGSDSDHTITKNGNITQGSFGPFARPDGEWSVGLNTDTSVTETGYLRVPSSGDFGTGNFTYEAWIYMVEGGGNPILLANSGGAVAVFRLGTTTSYLFGNNNTSGQTYVTFSDLSASTFQWHHIALVRSSGVIKCYLNGTASSTTLSSSAATGAAEYIGTARNYTSGSRLFDGYISNVRFSDVARYTSNFTPSTAPFVSDSNTDLLTCQSNRFVDNSSNGRTVTPYGQSAVTTFGPFLTSAVYDPAVNGASAHIATSGEYFSIANSSEFFMGNDAYTIEFWNFGGPSGTQYVFDNYKAGGTGGMTMYLTTAGKIHMRLSTTGGYKDTITSDGAFIINQWSHIAVVRTYVSSNTTVVIYVNGVAKKTSTFNNVTAVSNTTEALTIGFPSASLAYTGYLCDFRMVKGTAVYTGNFTPPTAPLTNITNTKLLLNMSNGQAIDNSAQNNLTLFGTAKLSTGQAKFGDTSILFDGNSDYLTFPHSESNDISGAGNWTVEFFWRFVNNDATRYQEIVSKGVGFQLYGNQGALSIALSANNTSSFFLSTTGGTTLSDNTWYHIAAVKNGTAYNVYLNGTNEANLDGTSSSNVSTGTDPWMMGAVTGSNRYYANGYMDECRISHFARYTGNFTAPSEPFPDKGQ